MWWVRKQSRVSQAGDGIEYSRTGDGTYYSRWATGDGQISRAEYSITGDVQSSVIRWASTWPQPRPQTTTLKTNHCSSSTWDNLEIDLRQLGNKFETTWRQLEDNFETTPSDHHPHNQPLHFLLSICHCNDNALCPHQLWFYFNIQQVQLSLIFHFLDLVENQ